MLKRDEDVSGMSGTGYVAEGVEFWDGTCALHWRTPLRSTTIYADVQTLETIHSHEGRTNIVWIDEDMAPDVAEEIHRFTL